ETSALPAVTQANEPRRLQEHSLPYVPCAEIVVALDGDADQLVARSQLQDVGDVLLVGPGILHPEIHLRVKKPSGLKIVVQVAGPLHQQVAVDAPFVENGNILL